jgi:hypothetical protein
MKRIGYVEDGAFVEALWKPKLDIMHDAYGKCLEHTCGECRFRYHPYSSSSYSCRKTRVDDRIECPEDFRACGRWEARA